MNNLFNNTMELLLSLIAIATIVIGVQSISSIGKMRDSIANAAQFTKH